VPAIDSSEVREAVTKYVLELGAVGTAVVVIAVTELGVEPAAVDVVADRPPALLIIVGEFRQEVPVSFSATNRTDSEKRRLHPFMSSRLILLATSICV
jgi:hypothetical protein